MYVLSLAGSPLAIVGNILSSKTMSRPYRSTPRSLVHTRQSYRVIWANSVGNVAVPGAHDHSMNHNHAEEHGHNHSVVGCCSNSVVDSQLSRGLKWILTETGVMQLVHCFEHSDLAVAASAAALVLSGSLG